LAAGVCVLAPDQPNLRERIEDGRNGLLFEPGSAASLSEKLAGVLADRGRAAQLGDAGRQSLIEGGWTWRGNARRVIECYREVVA
jgi:glycosyltransferase involved in cell wall biosynthesis